MKKFRYSLLLLLLSAVSYAQDITGDWSGVLKVQSAQLTIVLHVSKVADGYSATMDSPDQNARGIQVTQTSFVPPVLTLTIATAGVSFQGSLDEQQSISGTFKQGGQSIPLVLTRKSAAEVAPLKRPQEPVKPYPYYSEEVNFKNETDKVTLAGTLTLPKKEGNFPAVI